MVTIELGELTAAEEAPGPELSARDRRTMLVALVVIAILFGAAAARPAQRGFGAPLWSGTISLAGFTLGHDSLFSAETNGRVVVARDLRTGRDQWRVDIDGLPLETLEVGDGVAAVVTRLPSPEGEHEPLMTLVDARTGHVIGRTQGSMAGPATSGHRVVLQHQRTLETGDCTVWGEPCLDVFAVDTRTGSTVDQIGVSGPRRYAVTVRSSSVRFAVIIASGASTMYGRFVVFRSYESSGAPEPASYTDTRPVASIAA